MFCWIQEEDTATRVVVQTHGAALVVLDSLPMGLLSTGSSTSSISNSINSGRGTVNVWNWYLILTFGDNMKLTVFLAVAAAAVAPASSAAASPKCCSSAAESASAGLLGQVFLWRVAGGHQLCLERQAGGAGGEERRLAGGQAGWGSRPQEACPGGTLKLRMCCLSKINCTNLKLNQIVLLQVELENARALDRSSNLWSSLEESGWIGITATWASPPCIFHHTCIWTTVN